jgi:uncharacterized protein (DUF302 family)
MGLFAPCSLYMYVDEDEETLHIGMPRLANWLKVVGVDDAEKIEKMENLDADVISTFEELGAELVE